MLYLDKVGFAYKTNPETGKGLSLTTKRREAGSAGKKANFLLPFPMVKELFCANNIHGQHQEKIRRICLKLFPWNIYKVFS